MEFTEKDQLFLAIDANAIIHRAFHAFPDTLVTSKGTQVDAVFGFTSMLLSVLERYQPKYIACAFDTKAPTFRHIEYPDYKGTRKPTDHSLLAQFPLVEDVLKAFNIPIIKKEGFEADDILGELAEKTRKGKWSSNDLKMVIVSGDRDLLQLVGDNVYVVLPEGSFRNLVIYDEKETVNKLGVKPKQIVDYKALVGDPSDNIPGIKGIGQKSVMKFLEKYGSVDELYANLSDLPEKQARLLRDGVEQMEMSRKLAKIVTDVGVDPDLESCLFVDFDRQKVLDLFREFEFRTLMNKIPMSYEAKKIEQGQFSMFDGGKGDPGEHDKEVSDMNTTANEKHLILQRNDIPTWGISDVRDRLGKRDATREMDKICILFKPASRVEKILSSNFDTDGRSVFTGGQSDSRGGDSTLGSLGELFGYIVDNFGQVEWFELDRETKFTELLSFIRKLVCETYFFGWETLIELLIRQTGVLPWSDTKLKIYDVNLIAHVLSANSNKNTYNDLCYRYLGKESSLEDPIEDVLLNAKEIVDLIEEEGRRFSIKMYESSLIKTFENDDRDSILLARPESRKALFNNIFDRISQLETWLSVIIAEMEANGVCVDVERLQDVDKNFSETISEAEKKIFFHVGYEFNVNSPKQLSQVLFDDLKLPMGRGRNSRSTREEVLLGLQDIHPAISHILEYRTLAKLHGTYIKPLIQKLKDMQDIGAITIEGEVKGDNDSEDTASDTDQKKNLKEKAVNEGTCIHGFGVHTNFIQTGTSSGRLASQEPNMQNLPTGDENADLVKSIFVPKKGYKFLSMDYSQIELRVLAAISKDKNMTRDFVTERDIHASTASRILDKPLKSINKRERQLGKTINFGIVYGQTKYGLSRMLGISVDQADEYITEYLSEYEGVKEYVEMITKFCSENGYVETLLGRKRYIKGILSMNTRERESAVREAINMPVQGSAADIIKLAMFDIDRFIEKKSLQDEIRLVLQVHDELIFEVKTSMINDISDDLVNIFGSVVDLGVPLVVHQYQGDDLSQLK